MMINLFDGVDLNLALQGQSGSVLVFMQMISLLGQVEVYLLLLPAIYWLYNPRLGIRLALIVSCNGWANDILKQLFHLPRPYWVSSDVRMLDLDESISFGFPSGHSQIPVSFLGMIGYWLKSIRLWIVILILLFVIGLSRVYVGVHFPLDILGGWGIGIAILLFFILIDRPASQIIRKLSRNKITIVAFLISLAMICMSYLVRAEGRALLIPLSWAAFDHNTLLLTSLFSPSTSLITTGLFFGSLTGWAFARDTISYHPGGSLRSLGERYLLGMAGMVLIYGISGLIIHTQSGELANLLAWVRGALLGLWICYGALCLFQKLGYSSVQNYERKGKTDGPDRRF